MTSKERHEIRYQRRRNIREKRRQKNLALNDNFEWVFSVNHLYQSYKLCRKGVSWKSSVQKYITQAPLNIMKTYDRLMNGEFKTQGFYEFDIMERGKRRHIKSVTINERVVQRCLCDYALVPVLERTFIHDNGASRKDKGYSFAIRRLTQHLREHQRKYGNEGYVLLFDFSKFFDRVSHRLVKEILRKQFSDEKLIKLIEHFINAFGDIGMGLGSQISQTLALASANQLDHYIKEIYHIRGYGRYMDDGYLIHQSKEYLKKCLEDIREICKELEITLNEKKTQIIKLSHGFTWLKVRFFLTSTGKVVRKIYRKSVTKMRQKLKIFAQMVNEGMIEYKDVYASWQSWKSYANTFNAYHTIRNMAKLYDNLFIKPFISQEL